MKIRSIWSRSHLQRERESTRAERAAGLKAAPEAAHRRVVQRWLNYWMPAECLLCQSVRWSVSQLVREAGMMANASIVSVLPEHCAVGRTAFTCHSKALCGLERVLDSNSGFKEEPRVCLGWRWVMWDRWMSGSGRRVCFTPTRWSLIQETGLYSNTVPSGCHLRQHTSSQLLVSWSNSFGNPPHLSDVRLGGGVSDNFSNFLLHISAKLKILH